MARTSQRDLTEMAARISSVTGVSVMIGWAYGHPRLESGDGSREISPRLPSGALMDWMRAYLQGWYDHDRQHRSNPRPRRTKRRQRLIRHVRFFRSHAGGVVGEATKGALELTRAEEHAKRMGWEYEYLPEVERYKDVYGYDDPGGDWVTVVLKSRKGTVLASLGFVDANDSDYLRVVRAELASEAMHRHG